MRHTEFWERMDDALGAGYAPGDVKLQPWGDHDFRITDPDGLCLNADQMRLSFGGVLGSHRAARPCSARMIRFALFQPGNGG